MIIKRLWGSPIKILSFIIICYGLLALFVAITYAESAFPMAFMVLGSGIAFYFSDYIIDKYCKKKRNYWLFQTLVFLLMGLGIFLIYCYKNKGTTIVFPGDGNGEAVIIFGIKGYPPLPRTFFWRKTIVLPANGILITSNTFGDLPYYVDRRINSTGIEITRRENYIKQPCIVNNVVFSALYFSSECYDCDYYNIPKGETNVQKRCSSIYDSLIKGQLYSFEKDTSQHQVIQHTSDGISFDMSGCKVGNHIPVPDTIANINLHKAVFSCRYIRRVPKAILNNPYLEELYMDNTQMDSLPDEISKMRNLRILDISNNNLESIPDDIRNLTKLEILDISDNQLPRWKIRRVQKLLPHVKIYAD